MDEKTIKVTEEMSEAELENVAGGDLDMEWEMWQRKYLITGKYYIVDEYEDRYGTRRVKIRRMK